MKVIKKIAALLLVAVMALTVVGCHKKDEIAVTINGIKFTSAYYMCALVNANMEAKEKVNSSLSEDEQSTEIDYYSKKVDDKKFVDWVKDKAIETLKKVAAYKLLCEENKIEIDKEKLTTAETNANFLWSSYGYGAYFEPNGVSLNTYLAYTKDTLYGESYFESIYGKDGSKAISDADVKTKINDNFQIADILDGTFDTAATTDDTAALRKTFEAYAKDLQAGTKTFEQVYKEHNKEETHSHDDTTEDSPKDPHAQIIGAKDTNFESTFIYEKLKAMKVGEAKVIDNEAGTGITLLFKQDINADPYYLKNLDSEARHLIADDEFNKLIEDYAKKLKPEINNYAVNRFKVKKIEEPTYN